MVTNKKEVTEVGKIFEQLKKDARAIMGDLSLGIRSFGVIGIMGIVLGIWSIGEGFLALFFSDIPFTLFLPYVVIGVVLIILGAWIVRRFRHLKRKYSWVFKAEKSLRK